MKIVYTKHALDQIKERKMEKVWIEEVLKFPDITRKGKDKYYARKKLNGYTIEVAFIKERYIKVITAYWL